MQIIKKKATDISYSIEYLKCERVLIKPNIVSCEPYPTTTDPVLLDIVLSVLNGPNVTVADGPSPDKVYYYKDNPIYFKMNDIKKIKESSLHFWEDVKKYVDCDRLPHELEEDILKYLRDVVVKSDIANICNKHGVKIKCFDTDFEYREFEEQGIKMKIVKLDDFDVILTLPVLKLHSKSGFTGARKILFGLIDYFDKIKIHLQTDKGKFDFIKLIDNLPKIVEKDILTILDATLIPNAQEMIWGGVNVYKADIGLIIGDDPNQIDDYAARYLRR